MHCYYCFSSNSSSFFFQASVETEMVNWDSGLLVIVRETCGSESLFCFEKDAQNKLFCVPSFLVGLEDWRGWR